MYYLEELFCRLANGVLSNTSLVSEDTTTIRDDMRAQVIVAANEALTRLHSRFILKENNVIVEMQEGRTNYPLLKKYAVTSYDPKEVCCPYIMDLAGEPFTEDVIKILSVYDTYGCRRLLNDDNACCSLFTPRPNVLQNNAPRAYEALSVVYQASHPKLSAAEDGVGEIDLPETLNSAFDSYIAYRYYTSLNLETSSAKAMEYLQIYESICNEVTDYDLVSNSYSRTNVLFSKRGWM